MRLISMRRSSVLALMTVTWMFFCLRAAASGSGACSVRTLCQEVTASADVVALDAHFDGAESDFKEVFLDLALHHGDLVHRLEADLIADGDVLEQVRLGVGVADIRAGAVGDDGLVEALLKLAAQALDAAFGLFGELLLADAIFDGADRLAHLKLEVLEQRGQLGFEFAGALAQLDVALAGELGALLIERILLARGRPCGPLRAGSVRCAACRGSG